MFPHIPLHTIAVDLTNTQSISHTVDNILNGSVSPPPTSPLATPLSTTGSPQGGAVPRRTAPVSDIPTPSAAVKSIDQEHAASEFAHSGQRVEESTEPDASGKEPLVCTEFSTDRIRGFSDSDSGLRKRTSATTSSQLVGEPSSSQDVRDVMKHDGEDSTRCLTDGSAVDSEEHQPTLREDTYLTLQQRKNNMLQAAKHRYLQNHPGGSSYSSPPLPPSL